MYLVYPNNSTGAADVFIIQYIRNELPRKFGLITTKKDKFEALDTDLDNLTQTLWRTSKCQYRHERIRIQFTFYLLIHAYLGARTGTFVNTSRGKGSRRCLTYKVSGIKNLTCSWLIWARIFDDTSITGKTEPLGGCLRSQRDFGKEMQVRLLILPVLLVSVTKIL